MSNVGYCLNLLANSIRTEAEGGKAHLVGVSIGAHIAVLLAQRYPRLVISLTISAIVGFRESGKSFYQEVFAL